MKRMMGRRYSARQRAYDSPRGIGHISHRQKLWMEDPARGEAYRNNSKLVPFAILTPFNHFFILIKSDPMLPNVSASVGDCTFQKSEMEMSSKLLLKAIGYSRCPSTHGEIMSCEATIAEKFYYCPMKINKKE